MFPGRWYDDVRIGERFGTRVTVTEAHLVLGSGMFGDFNPLHVDEEFARKSMFGGRILHGPFTSALVAAPVGMYFSGTAIAYLEHACRFKKAVRPGDTLATGRGAQPEGRARARRRRQDPGQRPASRLIQRRSIQSFHHHAQRPSALHAPRAAIA